MIIIIGLFARLLIIKHFMAIQTILLILIGVEQNILISVQFNKNEILEKKELRIDFYGYGKNCCILLDTYNGMATLNSFCFIKYKIIEATLNVSHIFLIDFF